MNRELLQIYGSSPAVQWLLGSGRFYSSHFAWLGFLLFVCLFWLSFSLQLFQVTGRKHTAVVPQGTAEEQWPLWAWAPLPPPVRMQTCSNSLRFFLSCIPGQTHFFPETLVNLSEQLRNMAALQIKLCWKSVTKFWIKFKTVASRRLLYLTLLRDKSSEQEAEVPWGLLGLHRAACNWLFTTLLPTSKWSTRPESHCNPVIPGRAMVSKKQPGLV